MALQFMYPILPRVEEMLGNLTSGIIIDLSSTKIFDGKRSPTVRLPLYKYYMADAVTNHFTEYMKLRRPQTKSKTTFNVRDLDYDTGMFFDSLSNDQKKIFINDFQTVYGDDNDISPTVACFILNRLEAGRVLDPLIDLGGIALSCLALGIEYIGFEKNPDFQPAYQEITKFFNHQKIPAALNIFDFTMLNDEQLASLGQFSTILTKLPINIDILKFLTSSFNLLILGGNLCLRTNNPKELFLVRDILLSINSPVIKPNHKTKIYMMKYRGVINNIYIWQKIKKEIFTPTDEGNPHIKIEQYKIDNSIVNVISDHLLLGGTKVRALIPFMKLSTVNEFVYPGPETGYGQVALSVAAREASKNSQFHDTKRATIFVSSYTKDLTEATRAAKGAGGNVNILFRKKLADVQVIAEKYVNESVLNGKDVMMMPFGFMSDQIIDILSQQLLMALGDIKQPNRLWMVVGSGMILSALKRIWPTTEYLLIRVGKRIDPELLKDINYTIYSPVEEQPPLWFEHPATILPPYPSVKTYDAKVWKYVLAYAQDGDFIWNVAADN